MPLDGFVVVDLDGFVKLVNAVDGLWIRIPEPVYDDHYPKLDGPATSTSRSGPAARSSTARRHSSTPGPVTRTPTTAAWAASSSVLLSLRRQLDPVAVLERAPELLKIAKDHLWTTIKRKDLPSLVELAARVNAKQVEKVLFVPPRYPEYLSTAEIKQIRQTVRHVFDGGGSGSGGGGSGLGKACP